MERSDNLEIEICIVSFSGDESMGVNLFVQMILLEIRNAYRIHKYSGLEEGAFHMISFD